MSFVDCPGTISRIVFLTKHISLQRYKAEWADHGRQIEKEPQQNQFESADRAPPQKD